MSKKKGAIKITNTEQSKSSTTLLDKPDSSLAENSKGRLPNDLVAIRSQVLQHVSTKNKEAIDSAIAAFRDTQQVELEKLSRQFENDLCQKLKLDVHSQVMQKIKQQNLLDWHDSLVSTIRETTKTHVRACLDDHLSIILSEQKESLMAGMERRITSVVDTRLNQAINAERKRNESSMWAITRKSFRDDIKPMFERAKTLEHQRHTDTLSLIEASSRTFDERITALSDRMSQLESSVTKTLSQVDEVTKEGVARLQSSTSHDIARLEHAMNYRIGGLEETVAIQVETMSAIWDKMINLQEKACKQQWPLKDHLDDKSPNDEEPLISFEEATTFTVSSKSSKFQQSDTLLDTDTFEAGENEVGFHAIDRHDTSDMDCRFDQNFLMHDLEHGEIVAESAASPEELEPGEIVWNPQDECFESNSMADSKDFKQLQAEAAEQDTMPTPCTGSISADADRVPETPSKGGDACSIQ